MFDVLIVDSFIVVLTISQNIQGNVIFKMVMHLIEKGNK